jgi:hypothetical protein
MAWMANNCYRLVIFLGVLQIIEMLFMLRQYAKKEAEQEEGNNMGP